HGEAPQRRRGDVRRNADPCGKTSGGAMPLMRSPVHDVKHPGFVMIPTPSFTLSGQGYRIWRLSSVVIPAERSESRDPYVDGPRPTRDEQRRIEAIAIICPVC